jgi:hypothetical protein
VSAALQTQEKSLSLISLLWRAVEGPLFDAANTKEFPQVERQAVRDTLAAVESKAQEWRQEIFEQSLDPYLIAGRQTSPSPYPLPGTKAGGGGGIGYRYDTKYYLSNDLNAERWGAGPDPNSREAAAAYVRDHRYTEQMDLVFTGFTASRPNSAGAVGSVEFGSLTGVGLTRMGPFDIVETGTDVIASFTIKGDIKQSPLPAYDRQETSLLHDGPGEQDVSTTFSVRLQAKKQYTYVEVLNTAYAQHPLKLLAIAHDWLSANTIGMWDQHVPVITAVYENGALLWPAIREILESNTVIPTGGTSGNATRVFTPAEVAEIHRRAVLKDIDFWMF